MLFLAGKHSYDITRAIVCAARCEGLDGIIYPSYFSMLRNGGNPIGTMLGLSRRLITEYKEFEAAKIAWSIAVFGRPILDRLVEVSCINRVVFSAVHYSVHFGPVFCGDKTG